MSAEFDKVCERAAAYANRHGSRLEYAERFILRTVYGRGTFGIEYVSVAGCEAAYINTGDTYGTTVLCEGGNCEVSTWGDWVEAVEAEHCEDEGVIRCGYCGEFTPVAEEWRDTRCECCGRNVQTGMA